MTDLTVLADRIGRPMNDLAMLADRTASQFAMFSDQVCRRTWL